MSKLTSHQIGMLKSASLTCDGSVMAKGFAWSRFSTATGTALHKRGYLAFVVCRHGYWIYRITPDGRAALAKAKETA